MSVLLLLAPDASAVEGKPEQSDCVRAHIIDLVLKFGDDRSAWMHLRGREEVVVHRGEGSDAAAQTFERTNRGLQELIEQRRYTREMLDPEALRGLKLLDLGTGDGQLIFDLREHGVDAIGVDIALKSHQKDKPFFVAADAAKLPFADASFDRIFSAMSVYSDFYKKEFTDEFMHEVLSETRRVLKPGGRALLSKAAETRLRSLLRDSPDLADLEIVRSRWRSTDESDGFPYYFDILELRKRPASEAPGLINGWVAYMDQWAVLHFLATGKFETSQPLLSKVHSGNLEAYRAFNSVELLNTRHDIRNRLPRILENSDLPEAEKARIQAELEKRRTVDNHFTNAIISKWEAHPVFPQDRNERQAALARLSNATVKYLKTAHGLHLGRKEQQAAAATWVNESGILDLFEKFHQAHPMFRQP